VTIIIITTDIFKTWLFMQ